MTSRWVVLLGALVAVAAGVVLYRFAFFLLPVQWTGEVDRLAELLQVGAGSSVADIGAGDGSHAVAMAEIVGPRGMVYASELSAERHAEIHSRVTGRNLSQVSVVKASADDANLPGACCDAVYLRAVLHHVSDRGLLARQLRDAVRPNGRAAVIDFPPGALWFHGRDHGVTSDAAIAAFTAHGWTVVARDPTWGGGMFMVLLERR